MDPIASLDQIRREAAAAAQRFADVNDACPYPFDTDKGRAFSESFREARAAQSSGVRPSDNSTSLP